MAATLVEIKSAMLMPRIDAAEADAAEDSAENDDANDPRFELVQQLLAYKRFKDAALNLEARRSEWEERFPANARTPKPVAVVSEDDADPDDEEGSPAIELDLEDLGVNDLCNAFGRLLDSIGFVGDHKVTYDETPISLHAEDIADRLLRDGKPVGSGEPRPGMTLRELFIGRSTKSEMIGLFLATLELVRQRRVRVMQPADGGDIRLVLRPEADRNDLDDDDAARPDRPVKTGSKDTPTIAEGDLAAYDWPDDATRKRVERRIRLRAAHAERAEEAREGGVQPAASEGEPGPETADEGGHGGARQPLPLPGAQFAGPHAEA